MRSNDAVTIGTGIDATTEAAMEDIIRRTCQRARLHGTTHYACVTITVPSWDPVLWLSETASLPRFYWHGRWSDVEFGFAGSIRIEADTSANGKVGSLPAALDTLRRCVCNSEVTAACTPRVFFAAEFDHSDHAESLWAEFPATLQLLPEATLVREGRKSTLLLMVPVHAADEPTAVSSRLTELLDRYRRYPTANHANTLPAGKIIADPEARDHWGRMIDAGLERIAGGDVRKVVLSRRICWTATEPIPVWEFVRRMRERAFGAYHFACQLHEHAAFVGASPERLFRLSGSEIETECVAGTVPRDTDEERDTRLSESLMASAKDRLEHSFVIEDVLESLRELCRHADVGAEPWILRLPTVQHLVTTARGRLRDDVTIGDVLARLHPTPAVGGTPREASLAAIRAIEGRSRGWYAGPVGWMTTHEAEIAVAIRSALIVNDKAYLFVGAGIVPGSTPQREWDETEAKAQSMLSIFLP